MRILGDRVGHKPSVRSAGGHDTDFGLQHKRLFQHAWHRTQQTPGGSHLRGIGDHPLTLSVVPEPSGLQDRWIPDLRVSVRRIDDRVRTDWEPLLAEKLLLSNSVLSDANGMR